MVAILREPCDRTFSNFTFHRLKGNEPCADLFEAIEADKTRAEGQRFNYISNSLYHRNLSRYLEVFDSAQIKVVFNEDLKSDAPGVMASIFEFLGVDPLPAIDTEAKLTVSGAPKSEMLHWLLGQSNPIRNTLTPILPSWARDVARKIKNANLERQRLTPQQRVALREYFREDIERLEGLLGTDLGRWLADQEIPPDAANKARTGSDATR